MSDDSNRRPIAARASGWATSISAALARSSVTPNQISMLSIVFAALGAAMLWLATPLALVVAAVCIQLRLVCNLLDGMVAMEGGKKTPTGALYNEFPDRVADSLLIIALGYACGAPWLGWLGALAAALTAYVRLAGGSLGLAQDFRGPMAKQHRMAVLTIACVVGAAEVAFAHSSWALRIAAWVIAIGALLTCITRSRAIAAALHARDGA